MGLLDYLNGLEQTKLQAQSQTVPKTDAQTGVDITPARAEFLKKQQALQNIMPPQITTVTPRR